MAGVASVSSANHNHVEKVSPNEWEDEASFGQSGAAPLDRQSAERPTKTKPLRDAAAALRSSFAALRQSSTVGPKPSPSGRRESTPGFVGSLLHGLANAVGFHRECSPAREPSVLDLSPGRSRHSSQTHMVARLSSAALMRAELQNLGQFGDLRNDSFTSRSCAKLRRRSSLLLPRLSDANISVPGPPAGPPLDAILTLTSGDLDRRSTLVPPYSALQRLTCPGELPSPGAAQSPYNATAAQLTSTAREQQQQQQHPKFPAAPPSPARDAAGGSGDGAGACGGGGGGLHVRRLSINAPGSLAVEIPSLPSTLSPHPPLHPPPQARPSGSSLSPLPSRSTSTDHLPPMTPGGGAASGGGGGGSGLQSVRDRPPTPRGHISTSSSPTSTLARVLSSFHLPEIITPSGKSMTELRGSGKSVTERRVSASSGGGAASSASFTRPADFGMPRSRRNSVCSGPAVTGPGGAAISASLAKRAAAAAAAAAEAATSSGGGAGGGGSSGNNNGGGGSSQLVTPSASSSTSLPRPSGPLGTARTRSYSKPFGGILQDFQSSLELDEDGAMAAVDAEFDRRFGQSPPDVPGAVDGVSQALPPPPRLSPQHPQPLHIQPLKLPNLPQSPLTPPTPPSPPQQLAPEITPRAPASERTTPQGAPRRAVSMVDGRGDGGRAGGSDSGGGGGGPPMYAAPRHVPCATTTMAFDSPDDGCASQSLLSSADAPPTFEHNANKMRLASIRLSYAEGIVGGGTGGGGGGGPRASLDLPHAPLPSRGPSGIWTPQPPPGLAPPPTSRPMGQLQQATAAAVGAAL